MHNLENKWSNNCSWCWAQGNKSCDSLQFVQFVLFHGCEQGVFVCLFFVCFFLNLLIEDGGSAFSVGKRESLETGSSPLLFSLQLKRNNDLLRRNSSGSAGLGLWSAHMQLWLLVAKLRCPRSDIVRASLVTPRSPYFQSQGGQVLVDSWGQEKPSNSFCHRYSGFIFIITQCTANFFPNLAIVWGFLCDIAQGPRCDQCS